MKKISNLKKYKGITMIALVITVVVMLILAGIVISLTIGDNGLINKLADAKEDYKNAENKEKQELDDLYSQMLIATNDDSQITISMADLKTLINEQVEQKLQNVNIDYSKEENEVTLTKEVVIPANSWLENIDGPTIGPGTWLIFISGYTQANAWIRVGFYGTGMPSETYGDGSYNAQISNSGYYSGEETTLWARFYNGTSVARTYSITFRALKISDSY